MADNAAAVVRLPVVAGATAKNNYPATLVGAGLRRELGSAITPIVDISGDLNPPAALAATSAWTSAILPSFGLVHCAIAGKLSQAGNCVLTKYADLAGNLPVGYVTALATANSAFSLESTTGLFQAFSVSISNSASSAATLSSFACLFAAR